MNIIIIGNGITGITCARNIRKKNSDATITVISDESEHFYSRTALMYIYMGHMKYENTKPYEDWFWSKNRINLIQATVNYLNTVDKSIELEDSRILNYDKLVLATGSIPNNFGFPGEDLNGVQALYNLQDLAKMEKNTSNISSAVIVGGGLIGIEMAEMLHSRNISVTMLIRENAYWANVLPQQEAQLIGNHLHKHGIQLKFNTELQEIRTIDQVNVHSIVTKQKETIDCQFLGITTGVKPNIKFLKNSSIEIEKGILVNEFLETNIPDVFAAGDCAQFRFAKNGEAPIEQLWYTGKIQGETLANTICGNKTTYDRGIWFNSAKFFDLEFQTYGKVLAEITPEQESFYWAHENGKISFRANYNKSDRSIIGFNFIGIRFRQVIAEHWIREQKEIEYVIDNLKQGWFNPEFSDTHYEKIAKSFSNNPIN
jgi:NAD(P)H-nitrite reductase large subunit